MTTYYNRLRRQILSRVYLKRILILGFGFLILGFGMRYLFMPAFVFTKSVWNLTQVKLPQNNGRTNFLILGVGGGEHEGSDLTDSIILVSVSEKPLDVTAVSIPRDLWVPSLRAKINTLYHYGQEKQINGGGFILAKSTVSEIVGLPIHFAALIDFSGFEKIVSVLGGVEVEVLQAFEDQKYPITGREKDECGGDLSYACRFETIKFTQGQQAMDGPTALKFIRSRYSEGDEGSDFARSRRQEQVIKAIREKILRNPLKVIELQKLVKELVKTDTSPDLYPAIIRLGLKAYKFPIRMTVISEPDLLYNPPISPQYDLQWVLMPKGDDPHAISDYVARFIGQ